MLGPSAALTVYRTVIHYRYARLRYLDCPFNYIHSSGQSGMPVPTSLSVLQTDKLQFNRICMVGLFVKSLYKVVA